MTGRLPLDGLTVVAIEQAVADPAVRGIVLGSAHKDFCVGADLDFLMTATDPAAFLAQVRELSALYRRIEARIDWQLAHGMIEETRQLLAQGYGRQLGSMKGLGYRHLAAHFAGEYDADEMVRRFKQETRQFAKRQMTWFRKEPGIVWISLEDEDSTDRIVPRVIERIERFLASLGIPLAEAP